MELDEFDDIEYLKNPNRSEIDSFLDAFKNKEGHMEYRRTKNMELKRIVFRADMNSKIDNWIHKQITSQQPANLLKLMDDFGIVAFDLEYLRKHFCKTKVLCVFSGGCFKEIPEILLDPNRDFIYKYTTGLFEGNPSEIAKLKNCEMIHLVNGYRFAYSKVYIKASSFDYQEFLDLTSVEKNLIFSSIFEKRMYIYLPIVMKLINVKCFDYKYFDFVKDESIFDCKIFSFGCFDYDVYKRCRRFKISNLYLYYFFTGDYLGILQALTKTSDKTKEDLVKCLKRVPWENCDSLILFEGLDKLLSEANNETEVQIRFIINYIIQIVNPFLTFHSFKSLETPIPLIEIQYILSKRLRRYDDDRQARKIFSNFSKRIKVYYPIWTIKNHKLFPSKFKNAVFTLLCIQKRNYRGMDKNIFLKIFGYLVKPFYEDYHEHLKLKYDSIKKYSKFSDEDLFNLCISKKIYPYNDEKQIDKREMSEKLTMVDLNEIEIDEEEFIEKLATHIKSWKHLKSKFETIQREQRCLNTLIDLAKIYTRNLIKNKEKLMTNHEYSKIRKETIEKRRKIEVNDRKIKDLQKEIEDFKIKIEANQKILDTFE